MEALLPSHVEAGRIAELERENAERRRREAEQAREGDGLRGEIEKLRRELEEWKRGFRERDKQRTSRAEGRRGASGTRPGRAKGHHVGDTWRRKVASYFKRLGIRYLAFVRCNQSRYSTRARALGGIHRGRDGALAKLSLYAEDFDDTLTDLAKKYDVLFEERGLFVVDLGEC
jgi:hypothetical protein